MEPSKEAVKELVKLAVDDINHRFRHALPYESSPYHTPPPEIPYHRPASSDAEPGVITREAALASMDANPEKHAAVTAIFVDAITDMVHKEQSKRGQDVVHKGTVILSTKRAFEDFEQTAAMMSNINYDEDEIGAAIVNSVRTGEPVLAANMANDEDAQILLRATEKLRQGVVNAVNTAKLDHSEMDKTLVFDGWCCGDMVLEHIEIREDR